jgi:mannose-6-phosphate isomerase-like protein (cupin superfamily)
MPIIEAPTTPTHDLGPTRFTSLATPSRGSKQTAVWWVEIAPGAPATPHALTHEEVFVVLEGEATVRIGDIDGSATAGSTIVVPADTPFQVTSAGDTPLRMLCCFPVGGKAMVGDDTFTPPWAQ